MAEYFAESVGMWWWAAYALAALIHAVLLIHVLAVGALIFIWLERKVSGRIQDRLGPTRVGGKFGWLQTLADGLKLITKEDLMPQGADRLLFRAAPYIGFCASFAAYMALPFSDGWVAVHLNVAVFFILAVLGVEVFGVILAGYASASKWSLFGGMREAAQVVSYEVPLGLCVVVPVLIAGTMDLVTIGNIQAGWFVNWLIFHDPFTFVVFFVYFTCATASVNRAPFDLAEAESELVAGFHTEYSGLRWSYFFMAEYGSMFLVSALAATLFFGGWNGPIPLASMLQLTSENGPFLGYLGNFLGLLNFLLKSVGGVVLMIWVRWTLPRLRIDQVITTCLKYCLPIAAVMFLGAIVWTLVLPGRMFFGAVPQRFVPETGYGLALLEQDASDSPSDTRAEAGAADSDAIESDESAPDETAPGEAAPGETAHDGAAPDETGSEQASTGTVRLPKATDLSTRAQPERHAQRVAEHQ